MIISKEEIEKAADNYGYTVFAGTGEGDFRYIAETAFIEGANFVEEKVQEYVGDIIIENQGLKLYKDNEAKRFKELVVEFALYIGENYIFSGNTWLHKDFMKYRSLDRKELVKTTEELFDIFKKQKDGISNS